MIPERLLSAKGRLSTSEKVIAGFVLFIVTADIAMAPKIYDKKLKDGASPASRITMSDPDASATPGVVSTIPAERPKSHPTDPAALPYQKPKRETVIVTVTLTPTEEPTTSTSSPSRTTEPTEEPTTSTSSPSRTTEPTEEPTTSTFSPSRTTEPTEEPTTWTRSTSSWSRTSP